MVLSNASDIVVVIMRFYVKKIMNAIKPVVVEFNIITPTITKLLPMSKNMPMYSTQTTMYLVKLLPTLFSLALTRATLFLWLTLSTTKTTQEPIVVLE